MPDLRYPNRNEARRRRRVVLIAIQTLDIRGEMRLCAAQLLSATYDERESLHLYRTSSGALVEKACTELDQMLR